MKRQYQHSILALASGVLLAAPAFAAGEAGWFFGIHVVRLQPRLELPGISFAGQEESNYKLSAGYQFGPHWKAEFNYLDLGKPTLTTDALGALVSQDGKGKGLQAVGTATLPLTEKFGLYGKLGAFRSNLDSSCATSLLTCSAADRGTDLSYGVGMRYDFTKTVSVRGEWERFRRYGSRDTVVDADKDFFSVGVGFKF